VPFAGIQVNNTIAGSLLIYNTSGSIRIDRSSGDGVIDINADNYGMQMTRTKVIANAGTYDFPNGASARGVLFVTAEQDNATCEFMMRAGSGTTTLINDPVGICSATSGNAGTLNVFWNAGSSSYRVQNNRGGSRTMEFTLLGTGIL